MHECAKARLRSENIRPVLVVPDEMRVVAPAREAHVARVAHIFGMQHPEGPVAFAHDRAYVLAADEDLDVTALGHVAGIGSIEDHARRAGNLEFEVRLEIDKNCIDQLLGSRPGPEAGEGDAYFLLPAGPRRRRRFAYRLNQCGRSRPGHGQQTFRYQASITG